MTSNSKILHFSSNGIRDAVCDCLYLTLDDRRVPNPNGPKDSRVDVEYLYILLPYLKKFNSYCSLCVRNCTFGARTEEQHQLLRCSLYCAGRPICPFVCSIIIKNSGSGVIAVTNADVRHKRGVKISRPIRQPLRSTLKKQFANGAAVYRLYQDRLQSRAEKERKSNNYDVVGRSRQILRKIKSEGAMESMIAANVDEGVWKLYEQFHREVNADGKVTGAIQYVSKFPCQIIVFSEASIRLFDGLLKEKNVVVSWDATGSIIQERKGKPRLLYYELSVTLPGLVSEDSIVPITFMISDAHALLNVVHWLQVFKHSYAQVVSSLFLISNRLTWLST